MKLCRVLIRMETRCARLLRLGINNFRRSNSQSVQFDARVVQSKQCRYIDNGYITFRAYMGRDGSTR